MVNSSPNTIHVSLLDVTVITSGMMGQYLLDKACTITIPGNCRIKDVLIVPGLLSSVISIKDSHRGSSRISTSSEAVQAVAIGDNRLIVVGCRLLGDVLSSTAHCGPLCWLQWLQESAAMFFALATCSGYRSSVSARTGSKRISESSIISALDAHGSVRLAIPLLTTTLTSKKLFDSNETEETTSESSTLLSCTVKIPAPYAAGSPKGLVLHPATTQKSRPTVFLSSSHGIRVYSLSIHQLHSGVHDSKTSSMEAKTGNHGHELSASLTLLFKVI